MSFSQAVISLDVVKRCSMEGCGGLSMHTVAVAHNSTAPPQLATWRAAVASSVSRVVQQTIDQR